jgi:rod shape-determining protein MreD
VRAAAVVLAIALALTAQTTLARFLVRGVVSVDLVQVAVVYVALASGPVTGLLSGTVAGLLQDSLSTAVIGVGGLAKTIVGFLTGIAGTHFIVARPLTRFVVFSAATMLHQAMTTGLTVLIESEAVATSFASVLGMAGGNAVVGVVAFQVVEAWPGIVERRRMSRNRLRR